MGWLSWFGKNRNKNEKADPKTKVKLLKIRIKNIELIKSNLEALGKVIHNPDYQPEEIKSEVVTSMDVILNFIKLSIDTNREQDDNKPSCLFSFLSKEKTEELFTNIEYILRFEKARFIIRARLIHKVLYDYVVSENNKLSGYLTTLDKINNMNHAIEENEKLYDGLKKRLLAIKEEMDDIMD